MAAAAFSTTRHADAEPEHLWAIRRGSADGGGISIVGSGTATINQSTRAGNSANNSYGGGVGILNYATLTLYNSIVAGNVPDNLYDACGTTTSTGVNLTNGDPLLAPLGNYGGPTQTMLAAARLARH